MLRQHACVDGEPTESRRPAGDGREPGRTAPQREGGAECLPGCAAGVHELARRAASLAGDLRPLQPLVPHERPRGRGPGRAQAALGPRGQQLRRIHGRPGQALRAVQPRRLRHRRRHPVRARRGPFRPGRPGAGAQLDHVPRGDRRVRRRRRSRLEERAARGRTPQVVPVPGAGPERDAGDREGARRLSARARVLPHDDRDDRGQNGGCAAARHGRPAGLGALRPMGRRRGGARGARDGRRGVRPPPGGWAGVLVQYARVGVDPIAASGRVLGRKHEGLPRVAARGRVRGLRIARRQLRLRPKSRTTTSRRGISGTGATSLSTTTSSGGRRWKRWPAEITARRSRLRSTTRT